MSSLHRHKDEMEPGRAYPTKQHQKRTDPDNKLASSKGRPKAEVCLTALKKGESKQGEISPKYNQPSKGTVAGLIVTEAQPQRELPQTEAQ
mmetsp:Transcript_25189/g.41455  ORF Transcript_25189/g.41455 Transcript_25189/m.41455 type:complete len:91 (+) Transcript_25189:322-594(+)